MRTLASIPKFGRSGRTHDHWHKERTLARRQARQEKEQQTMNGNGAEAEPRQYYLDPTDGWQLSQTWRAWAERNGKI
jgi:hypothetical protein